MPPLRPAVLVSKTGFICSSCLARLRALRSPPWLARDVSTRSVRHRRLQRKGTDLPEGPASDLSIRYFDEQSDGSLKSLDNDTTEEDMEKTLDARIKALEEELATANAKLNEEPDRSLVQQLLAGRSFRKGQMDFKFSEELGLAEDEEASEEALSDIFEDEVNVHQEFEMNPSRVIGRSYEQSIEIPRSRFPPEHHAEIARLNTVLNEASRRPEIKLRKELWKRYAMVRHVLALAWHEIPYQAWETLWEQFSMETPDNPDRMAHIKRLGEDMEAANLLLDPHKTLLFIEALFLDAGHDVAISKWEDLRPALTLVDTTAVKYWALGARMLAHDNRPKEAQEAADIMFNTLQGDKDHRILIPLINSWLISDDEASLQRAWGIYVRLKYRLASNMKMSDFDDVMSIFLGNDFPELGLAVFRDMMLMGDVNSHNQDSIGLYTQNLKSVRNLNSFVLTQEELDWKSHKPFTTLPKKFRNKFFFGKWIKKLIGDGEIDWASKVTELMSQQGYRPDPKYQNGIIGAWLRSGTAKNVTKAEALAWRMIAARLEFVKQRARSYDLEGPIRLQFYNDDKKDFTRPLRTRIESLATLETFSVLIDHYQDSKARDRVQELMIALRAAKIPPSTNFLNGLLHLGARTHRKAWTWSVFIQMVHYQKVAPNIETFILLWRRMQTHVDPLLSKTKEGFPSCRSLYAEMVKWAPQLQAEGFPQVLYEQIISCFGIADDYIGTEVALRSTKDFFSLYPTEDTVRNVVVNLSKAGTRSPEVYSRRRQHKINAITQQQIEKFARVLKSLRDSRVQELQKLGVEFDSLDAEGVSEESLEVLCQFIRLITHSRLDSEEGKVSTSTTVDEARRLVAEEMGVPRSHTWF